MSVRPPRPSNRPSVQCYFSTTNNAVFEAGEFVNHIINNVKMSEDEVVAFSVPRGTCLLLTHFFLTPFCIFYPVYGHMKYMDSLIDAGKRRLS